MWNRKMYLNIMIGIFTFSYLLRFSNIKKLKKDIHYELKSTKSHIKSEFEIFTLVTRVVDTA